MISLNKLNLPKHLCTHLLGTKHAPHHHMLVGITMMAIGVAIAHFVKLENDALSALVDFCGITLHGVGLTPFIEEWTKVMRD